MLKKRKKAKRLAEHRDKKAEKPDENQNICHICNRAEPLFFYGNEDAVKRLPESYLAPVQERMRRDLKRSSKKYQPGYYLKYLNCSSKFIKPCNCEIYVHSYCQTAKIIQDRKIYCQGCECHYNFSIKREQGLISALASVMAHYSILLFAIFGSCCLFILSDCYLKHKHALKFPE